MKLQIFIGLSLLLISQAAVAADREPSIESAAAKYVPGVSWRAKSVVSGDFSCRGRRERAILGTNRTEIVVAIFLDGTNQKPEVLRYSTAMRDPAASRLKAESLDYDPKGATSDPVPGFRRSKTCKGLNLSDGKIDSAHIYWNRDAPGFADWSR